MAHKQGVGSTKNNRDSNPKFLGLKKINNQYIKKGEIIIKQRGLKYKPETNVGLGKDYTLFALKTGFVQYNERFVSINDFL